MRQGKGEANIMSIIDCIGNRGLSILLKVTIVMDRGIKMILERGQVCIECE